jgi:hypothetical protein
MVFTGLLASIEGTAKSRWLVAPRASTMAFGAKKSEGRFSVKDVSEEVRYHEYQKKASMREEACLVKIMSIQRLCPITHTTLFYYASDICSASCHQLDCSSECFVAFRRTILLNYLVRGLIDDYRMGFFW